MSADGHVVHIKFNLSEADVYDELFPPSLFSQPPDGSTSLPEDVPDDAETEERANAGDDAFEDVEEVDFVGKTTVCC